MAMKRDAALDNNGLYKTNLSIKNNKSTKPLRLMRGYNGPEHLKPYGNRLSFEWQN